MKEVKKKPALSGFFIIAILFAYAIYMHDICIAYTGWKG